MILLVTGKHLIDAFLVIYRPGVINSIGLSGIYLVLPNRAVLVILLCISSFLALWGLIFAQGIKGRLTSVILQQLLLLFMAGGALTAIIAGKYADGYVPTGGGGFILADQMPRIILAGVHVLATYKYSVYYF